MKYIFLMMTLLLLFSFTGCRVRVVDVISDATPPIDEQEPHEPPPPPVPPEPAPPEPDEPDESEPDDPEPDDPEPDEPPEDPTPTPPLPTIEPIAYEEIYIPTTEDEAPPQGAGTEENNPYDQLTAAAEDPPEPLPYVTIYTASPYAEGDTTLDADGDGTLGLIIDRNMGILNRGLGSLFECQRLYVYLEHLADFSTVNRSSPLHSLVVDSGGFNAAARRGNDALLVDAEWVTRRNPEVIIRTVSSNILGRGVTDLSSAHGIRNEILERPGFELVSAVVNRRVMLLSEELLHTDEGRLIAKLYIAHAMYPTLFADVDMTELLKEIATAGGADYTAGIFAFGN